MSQFLQPMLEDEPSPADICLVQEGLREFKPPVRAR